MLKYILIVVVLVSETLSKPLRFKVHQKIGPAPKPIKFDGFTRLDIDQYRPPSHLVEFDRMNSVLSAIEADGRAKLEEIEAPFKKVENEYLHSGLHQDAVSAKYQHITV